MQLCTRPTWALLWAYAVQIDTSSPRLLSGRQMDDVWLQDRTWHYSVSGGNDVNEQNIESIKLTYLDNDSLRLLMGLLCIAFFSHFYFYLNFTRYFARKKLRSFSHFKCCRSYFMRARFYVVSILLLKQCILILDKHRIWNYAEFGQRIICGTFCIKISAKYMLSKFRILQNTLSHFSLLALLFHKEWPMLTLVIEYQPHQCHLCSTLVH